MSVFQKQIDSIEIKLRRSETTLTDDRILHGGDEILLDFGHHLTGFLQLDILPHGHHPDAPLYFQVNFYEHISESGQDAGSYRGWISRSWIQEEKLHVDVLPSTLKLTRRYAFRYVKITVLDTSDNYGVSFPKITAEAVSSADDKRLSGISLNGIDGEIDRVCCRTLHECMQEVFEDGPKRDRRMWLGDLRLEALANYATYRQNDLVKKCLYMFAATAFPGGTVPANLFIHPRLEGDFQHLSDYSLLYITALKEYYENTGDMEALKELYPVALAQYRRFATCMTSGLPEGDLLSRAFIDWSLELDKAAAITGVYLYTLEHLAELSRLLSLPAEEFESELVRVRASALKAYYQPENHGCTSGGQYSFASAIWLVLGGVISGGEAAECLRDIEKNERALKIVSPYLYHYYIEALIKCGLMETAHKKIRFYWGNMLQDGADTFYEIFNPDDPEASPYGGKIVHSFCHAWSCTPAYFLRTYFS